MISALGKFFLQEFDNAGIIVVDDSDDSQCTGLDAFVDLVAGGQDGSDGPQDIPVTDLRGGE